MSKKIFLCLVGALICLNVEATQQALAQPTPQSANANSLLEIHLPVEKFILANGLTVLLHPDHSLPMISYHTWYRVGARDEKPGITGVAHMLEHMMFKGAKKYSGKQFDAILHQNGIVNNAFTTADYTGFYENLPSSKLELIMDLEVDRMQNLALQPEDLRSELEVVGEERRWRVDNNPTSLLQELVLGALFKVHPYRWPTIGTMEDIQHYTSEKLRQFYQAYYVPNNAVVVIAGDIDVDKTKQLVQKYYGPLVARPLPPRQYQLEPEPLHSQQVVSQAEVQTTHVMQFYKGVSAGTADSFALDLLANILGAGNSSRLYKKLVYQKQVAVGAGCNNISNADPGYFVLSAAMAPGKEAKLAQQVFSREILELQKHPVSARELEKAKNMVMTEYVEGVQTLDGRAESLAVNEIVEGDYRHLFTDLGKYQAVTALDLQRVAQKYLQPQRQVVGILNPKTTRSKNE